MQRQEPRRTAETCTAVVLAVAALCGVARTPSAHADVVAYLVDVTMRPGYHFANADAALDYGRGLCDKVSQGRSYTQVMSEVAADFDATDDYQASYLISAAVNELCPALIWQLRNSAAR